MLAWLIIAGVVALVAMRSARADRRSTADRHLERGLEHFEQQRYTRAIAEFQRGYAVEPRREFLFALGQAERLQGNCAGAVIYYRKFLSRNPPARQVDATWAHIGRCDRELTSARERAAPAPRPSPPLAVAATAVQPVDAPTRPWYRDPIGTSLLGASVVSAGTSLALFVAASGARDRARSAPTYGEFAELADRARTRRNLGITVGLAAGALAGAAMYRLVWGQPSRGTRLEVAPRASGATVAVGGSF
jgi:tetratricopeptide (TPR) repeat protein